MLKPKQSIENMAGYYVPMFENDWDMKLDSNENNYGASPKVIEALTNIKSKEVSFYPFYGELTQKIADFYGFKSGNVKVTNGADEAIQGIIQTYLDDGHSLLTVDVSFDMPVIYASIAGAEVIKVPYKTKWEFPIDDFIAEINDKVKVIYIASPNNPTGSVISENDLNKILEKSHGKAVIIDETYANYSDITFKDYVNKYDNIFLVRSFSKDFALAGLRLGCIISDESNIKDLKKVISPFSVNSLAMKAGIAALEDAEYFNGIKDEIISSKLELKEFFEKSGAMVYPSFANFLLIDLGEKADYVYSKLRKENIAIKLFKKGSLLENHVRLTIPTIEGTKKIKRILENKPFLVFDMDGVLIDASNSYRLAIAKTYEYFSKKEVSPEKIQATKNLGGLNNDWDLTQYLLKNDGLDIPYDEIVKKFQEFYWDSGKGFINNEELLFDKELIEQLSKKYNLAIFTGRLRAEAAFALKKFDIEKYFCPVITTDDIPEGKGKPDSYGLDLIKSLTNGTEYTYSGDTTDDVKAARSSGYTAVGVLPPSDKSQELTKLLKDTGAQFVLKSINDINIILEQENETVC
ncbi:aminotransferase class I/II-fold pyridoxal phosphate-dependent enzyme [bacterium]|nr:aminotransferase class I/II-fold pyridoxal phosphate-dependent enzyme [bacterium]